MIKIPYLFLIKLFFVLQLTAASDWSGGAVCSRCSRSRDCAGGSCCRNFNNQLVDPAFEGFQDFMMRGSFNSNNGMCLPGGAKQGEICSGGCSCQQGLVCYRPVSGICCPASRCQTKAYVDKQNEFWRNCHKNPQCFFPVK